MTSAPSRRAFFYPVPIFAEPGTDQLLVPLHGARFGLLNAPTQIVQKTADVILMVMYAKLFCDHFLHSRLRPAFRFKACGNRSCFHLFEQDRFVFRCQTGGASTRLFGL